MADTTDSTSSWAGLAPLIKMLTAGQPQQAAGAGTLAEATAHFQHMIQQKAKMPQAWQSPGGMGAGPMQAGAVSGPATPLATNYSPSAGPTAGLSGAQSGLQYPSAMPSSPMGNLLQALLTQGTINPYQRAGLQGSGFTNPSNTGSRAGLAVANPFSQGLSNPTGSQTGV